MRILIINISPNLSTGELVMNLKDYVKNQSGTCVTAAPPKKGFKKTEDHFVIGWRLNRRLNIFLSRRFHLEMSLSILSTIKFIKFIKKFKPDVIHLHNIHGYFLNFRILFKYLASANIPIIWTLHDCSAFTGVCHHYYELNCNNWKGNCRDCPLFENKKIIKKLDLAAVELKKKSYYYNRLKNLTITTVSNWLHNQVLDSILKEKNILTIYNGINLNDHIDSNVPEFQVNESKDFIVLGVASSWSANKGLLDFKILSKKLVNYQEIKLILIGLTPEQEELFQDCGNVLTYEGMGKKELISFYSSANVFLNLSSEESFGMVTLEAMASGAVCLVYETTANVEIVKDTDSVVCKSHDLDCVLKGILDVKNDKHAYNYTKTLKKIEENFNIFRILGEYYQLYRGVIGKHD